MIRSTLTKEIQFDAGHRVPAHRSKCRHPHGHRYRVVVEAEGPVPGSGMVVDFGVLKQWMTEEIHDRYDHAFIVDTDDLEMRAVFEGTTWRHELVPYPPTAENLAHLFHGLMVARAAGEPGLSIGRVTVWETPTSSASFEVDQ